MTTHAAPVEAFDLVIFGGTGDLALRKLLPALFHRYADGQIPAGSRVIGVARDALSDVEYRGRVRPAIEKDAGWSAESKLAADEFVDLVGYRALDATRAEGWAELAALLGSTGDRVRVFYLATGPDLFAGICGKLKEHGLNRGRVRVVIEKPIGKDARSAAAINDAVGQAFDEGQTFRIDHDLGKETVQNLTALRFANALFEPLW